MCSAFRGPNLAILSQVPCYFGSPLILIGLLFPAKKLKKIDYMSVKIILFNFFIHSGSLIIAGPNFLHGSVKW